MADHADARQKTGPRACEDSREKHVNADCVIHYESIKCGVQFAPEIRIDEMQKDNPWIRHLLSLLKGMTLPCSFQDGEALWGKTYSQGPCAV